MNLLRAVSLLTIATGACGSTVAQERQGGDTADPVVGLAEVIVTATKRSENLQDVPVAVSAVTSQDLVNKGVFETSDLSHSMPNLQVSSPYGEQQPNFSVRGVGVGTEYNANAASPVGVYVDEVYQAFRSSHGQQLYDLEQIEVVRGPQGTLYGRNTTGGAINFLTRKPELAGTNGYLSVGYGRFQRVDVEGAAEFTPVADKVGVRIAGTYLDTKGYIRNRLQAGTNTTGAFGLSGLNQNSTRDPGMHKSWGIRGTVRVKPSDVLDVSVKGYAARTTGGVEVPLPTGQSKTSDVIDYQHPGFLLGALFTALGPNGAGLLPGSYSQSGRGLERNEIEGDTVGRAVTRAEGGVLTVRAELNDRLRLVSITGYDSGKYEQLPNTDCDASPLRLCSIGYASSFHAFNQDLRLDFTSDNGFKAILGAYYGKDHLTSNNRPDFFNILSDVRAAVGLPASYFNPAGGFNGKGLSVSSLPTGIRATQHFQQDRKSYAVYGEASYELTDTVKLTAGLRYTSDKNRFHDGLTTYYDDAGTARMLTVSAFNDPALGNVYFLQPLQDELGNVVVPSFQALGIPVPGGLERKGSSKKLSGRAILDWKPVEHVMLYASFSRGYRAGTFNGLAYGNSNQVYFVRPEQVNAYETGFKTRLMDNRLQINGALFYYDYKGQQGQVVDSTATANLIALDGTLKGVEVDVQFAATSQLRLTAAFGLLDSKYKKYDQAACAAKNLAGLFPAQDGSCVQSSGGNVSVGGNPFPYAAKSSVNLGFDWDLLQVDAGRLELHGDASYTGSFSYDSFHHYTRGPLPNVAAGKFADGEGDFWVLNGRLTWSTERYSVAAWVKNLTNTVYYPYGISIENLFANGYRVRAQPRTYGVQATMKF